MAEERAGLKYCIYCCEEFVPVKRNQRVCPECRELRKSKKRKFGVYEKPSLNENIAAAKAAGMTYGHYKASLLMSESRVVI